MNKSIILLILFLGSFSTSAQWWGGGGWGGGGSASGSGSVYPSLDIRSFMNLNVFVGSVGTDYTFDSDDAYLNGIANTSAFTVQIKSNRNWRLSVASLTAFFTALDGGSNNIPCDIISLKKSNQGSFKNLQIIPIEITNGNRGNYQRSGNSFGIDMKMSPGMSYKGGEYEISLIYTLTPD